MPRGGRRPGAGRKPKLKLVAAITSAQASVPSTNYPPEPVEEFDAPDDLAVEERAVWLKQAPHAFRNGMLTRVSAMAFERYCKVVVLERNEARSSGVGGSNHRGLLKQINQYELQFGLIPNGRPMPEAAVPQQDEDEAFFGGRGHVAG
jgi:hypothetical protein